MEVEAKYRVKCESLNSIAQKLEALGFKKTKEWIEVDEYYQHPCRNFLVTDEALRIRQRGDGVIELTYKGPREKSLDYKGRLELTTVVADENSLREILEALGFRSAIVVIKKRRSYGKNGVEISLDEVDGLGCFIEIEGGLNEIETIARELSLRKEDYVAETYAELLLALRDSNRSHPGY